MIKKQVLIICQDYVGKSMAGPAIRSWEFANQLSKDHKVTLLVPNKPKVSSRLFKIVVNNPKNLKRELAQSKAVITQKITPGLARKAIKNKARLILDAYDPISIEALEANSHQPFYKRDNTNKVLLIEQSFSFIFADGVVCASEKQRDYWIGVLSSMNRITPQAYDPDKGLRDLIDIVPFGLSNTNLSSNQGHVLRDKFGLKKDDFVMLWGGGIWNWFDPLTLIEAVSNMPINLNVKLVFMGIDHPNKDIPRMPMVEKAINLSKKKGIYGKTVFFNEGWVPYDQRKHFLMDADVGVSMHYDHLETRFSFRTRMLDYLWAGLPIIATEGDSFAELIEVENLGVITHYSNTKSIEDAIVKLAQDKSFYDQAKNNIGKIKRNFYWQECVRPINRMIANWGEDNYPTKPSPTIVMNQLAGLYSARTMIAKKMLKKYFGLRNNWERLARITGNRP